MTSSTALDWVDRGVCGPLLGTFSLRTIYHNELAVGEVFWINDPTVVGLRYPDNSRMAVSAGWLQNRDKAIQDEFDKRKAEYEAAASNAEPPSKLKLKLKAKPKLVFKPKLGIKSKLRSRK